jgi:hypothetical protein
MTKGSATKKRKNTKEKKKEGQGGDFLLLFVDDGGCPTLKLKKMKIVEFFL